MPTQNARKIVSLLRAFSRHMNLFRKVPKLTLSHADAVLVHRTQEPLLLDGRWYLIVSMRRDHTGQWNYTLQEIDEPRGRQHAK